MNSAVMISIKPKWCRRIAVGEKTLEVRKTKPKLKPPFKCYIYCTKPSKKYQTVCGCMVLNSDELYRHPEQGIKYGDSIELMLCEDYTKDNFLNGKVIGEFVCDEIEKYETEFYQDDDYDVFQGIYINIYDKDIDDEVSFVATSNEQANPDDCYLCKSTCLSFDDIKRYIGDGDNKFYTWHISELKIYDKPKELSEFSKPNICHRGNEKHQCVGCWDCEITRPPQSWCYVEEVNE